MVLLTEVHVHLLGLDGDSGCDLLAGGRLRLRISSNHVAHGSFVVPNRGHCFQIDLTHRVTPGSYDVIFGCHVCGLTTFRVTRE
jgi:hypothetical protein